VFKTKGKEECSAVVAVDCPKPQPGKPMVTCNPPAPQPYTCPDGFADGDSLKLILRAGDTECYVDYGPMHCPKGARCNPPPPRKLPCPS